MILYHNNNKHITNLNLFEMKKQLFVWCLCTLVTLVGCMHASAQKEKGITFFSEGQLGWGFALGDESASYLGVQAQVIGYRFNPKANIGIGYGIHAYSPLFQAYSAYTHQILASGWYRLKSTKGFTPFVLAKIGYGFTESDYLNTSFTGLYFSPNIGYAYNLKDNGEALGLSIGYDYQAIGKNDVSQNNSAFTLKFTCFY